MEDLLDRIAGSPSRLCIAPGSHPSTFQSGSGHFPASPRSAPSQTWRRAERCPASFSPEENDTVSTGDVAASSPFGSLLEASFWMDGVRIIKDATGSKAKRTRNSSPQARITRLSQLSTTHPTCPKIRSKDPPLAEHFGVEHRAASPIAPRGSKGRSAPPGWSSSG